MDRRPLRLITYGLYIASIGGDSGFSAAVINWLTQASFEPPLLVIALKKGSTINQLFREKRYMTINIVPSGDLDMVKAFFGELKVEDGKVNGYSFRLSDRSGGFILDDSVGYIDVEYVDVYEAGDHDIFIARYVGGGLNREDVKPLVIWDTPWYYGG